MDPAFVAQIAESGLSATDLDAREASSVELAACAVPQDKRGYVIPYYSISGKLLPFYRVRFIDYEPKYKQPRNTPNHIYYPKNFQQALKHQQSTSDTPFIMVTEGERKAAAACKLGIPCIGFGGVDNWRTRIVDLPPGTSLTPATSGEKKWVQAKLPSTSGVHEASQVVFAAGMTEMLDLVKEYRMSILVCFDTDLVTGLKYEVQRACWALGNEFKFQGIPMGRVKQMILPYGVGTESKVALDDFIVHQGSKDLYDLIEHTLEEPGGFPRHPDPRSFITGKLERGKLSRRQAQELATTTLTELDSHGRRMRDVSTSAPFYFDDNSKKLMSASLVTSAHSPIHETDFGVHLYKEFGLSGADQKILSWLAAQYTGEDPVEDVDPVKVMTHIEDKTFGEIAVQISDSEFVVITDNAKQPFKICSNGTRKLLFMQGQVKPLDTQKFIAELQKQVSSPPENWWREVLETVNIAGEHSRDFLALLMYASPFLNRWRGTQLPVEILCGEAGSGKSSLYALRLSILTGIPLLRNIPTDLRDWHAGITSTGGLHVTDNVQFTDKNLRQRLSDEICRIITEPNPHVEMRRLYTTASQLMVPVHSTFAFTAIQQPFLNADLLQRAAVFEIEALAGDSFDGNWLAHTMDARGGREAWLAHQLVVLHRFFLLAKTEWDDHKKASHRLAHFEQCMDLLGKTLGISTAFLKQELTNRTVNAIASSDWTMQGIKEYAQLCRDQSGSASHTFTCADVAQWAEYEEEFQNNSYLKSSRQLGSYMQKHKRDIQRVCGVVQQPDKVNNRVIWEIA